MTIILNHLVLVNTQTCDIVASGIQLGFLGCLSAVSTFIAKFNAMRESEHPWRAYAYALITICSSFRLEILVYSVPVWTKGYGLYVFFFFWVEVEHVDGSLIVYIIYSLISS